MRVLFWGCVGGGGVRALGEVCLSPLFRVVFLFLHARAPPPFSPLPFHLRMPREVQRTTNDSDVFVCVCVCLGRAESFLLERWKGEFFFFFMYRFPSFSFGPCFTGFPSAPRRAQASNEGEGEGGQHERPPLLPGGKAHANTHTKKNTYHPIFSFFAPVLDGRPVGGGIAGREGHRPGQQAHRLLGDAGPADHVQDVLVARAARVNERPHLDAAFGGGLGGDLEVALDLLVRRILPDLVFLCVKGGGERARAFFCEKQRTAEGVGEEKSLFAFSLLLFLPPLSIRTFSENQSTKLSHMPDRMTS